MEIISALLNQDLPSLLTGLFILLSSMIAIYEIIGRFSKMIGRPVRWVREKERDHDLLLQTAKKVTLLQKEHDESVKQSIDHDDRIRSDLKNLTEIFIEKQINDYRWEIINFSNRVANGETCNKDIVSQLMNNMKNF